jgi:hypothetical protein
VELQLVGTVWRIVLALVLSSSSAQISSSSKLRFSRRRKFYHSYLFKAFHVPAFTILSIRFQTAGVDSCRGRAKERPEQFAYFQLLGNLGGCASCFSAGKRFRLEHLIAGREPGRGTLQGFFSYRSPSLPVTTRLSPRASGFLFPGLHAVALQVTVQAGSPDA